MTSSLFLEYSNSFFFYRNICHNKMSKFYASHIFSMSILSIIILQYSLKIKYVEPWMGNRAGPSLPLSLHFIVMYEQPVWRKCLLETRLAEAAELYSAMVPSKQTLGRSVIQKSSWFIHALRERALPISPPDRRACCHGAVRGCEDTI